MHLMIVTRRETLQAVVFWVLAIPVMPFYFPLRRLWLFPKTLKFDALEVAAQRDRDRAFDIDTVVAGRWYVREMMTMASLDTYYFFELELADSSTIVLDREPPFFNALRLRDIPISDDPIDLGDDAGLGWFGWLFTTAVLAFVIGLLSC